jgi:hypothetical protein
MTGAGRYWPAPGSRRLAGTPSGHRRDLLIPQKTRARRRDRRRRIGPPECRQAARASSIGLPVWSKRIWEELGHEVLSMNRASISGNPPGCGSPGFGSCVTSGDSSWKSAFNDTNPASCDFVGGEQPTRGAPKCGSPNSCQPTASIPNLNNYTKLSTVCAAPRRDLLTPMR